MSSASKDQRREMMRTFAQFQHECTLISTAQDLINILEDLRKYEHLLQSFNERACNGYHDGAAEERDNVRYERICDKVRAIAQTLNFSVQFNGDPRGGAIRFILPSGASNGWDGKTWGIYW